LHAHFATNPATVTALAARLAGISYSFTAHAKDIFHQGIDAGGLARKLRNANAVITVSDYNVRYLRERFGDDARNVLRLFNGLDLSLFPFAEPAARPPRSVAVGRLVEKQGFDVLVTACAELARRNVDFDCEIVGTGEMEAALAELVVAMNLSHRVRLIGPRPLREIIPLVQTAAVLAAPCVVGADGNRDGLPTVLLEAMALGTPCVATDVTGIPEVLSDDETGLLIPQRDPVALANALQRMLADSDLRVRLAAGARKRIEADFDIHSNAARQREIFDRCIAAARASTRATLAPETALT
jgi:colanic acid/amylovoran biosynthesis glycosyltransferase